MKKYNTNLFGQKLNVSQAIDSNAEGKGTITRNIGENANGTFNVSNTGSEDSKKTIHSIGIGTKDSDRSNALEIMQNGDIYLYGVGGYEGDNASDSKSIQSVIQDSQSGGDYTLPIASADTLGGIKVGEGLNIDGEGVLSSTGSGVGKIDPESDGTGEIFNTYDGEEKNIASGAYSHAEGSGTTASGRYSHAEGGGTTANNDYEHAEGICNKSNSGETSADKTQHSIGIGTGINDRKNAVEVMANGDVYINGVGSYDGTNYADAQTLQEVINSQSGGGVGKVDPKSDGTGEIFNDYTNNSASGKYSHSEGYGNVAEGNYSHVEGIGAFKPTINPESIMTMCVVMQTPQISEDKKTATGQMMRLDGKPVNIEVGTKIYTVEIAEGFSFLQTLTVVECNNTDTLVVDTPFDDSVINSNSGEGIAFVTQEVYDLLNPEDIILPLRSKGECSHSEGYGNVAFGNYSHAEGHGYSCSDIVQITQISEDGKKIYGDFSKLGDSSITDSSLVRDVSSPAIIKANNGNHIRTVKIPGDVGGYQGYMELNESIGTIEEVGQEIVVIIGLNYSKGLGSHTEGRITEASGDYSHAEGIFSTASGKSSHSEGSFNISSGNYSHSEGSGTKAVGIASHAEGSNCTSEGYYSHAEGEVTNAKGSKSHAEGTNTQAIGEASHAEGNSTIANGNASHAEGYHTNTSNEYEHACGKYNYSDSSSDYDSYKTIYSVGIGTSDDDRKNAFEISKTGNVYVKGIGGYIGKEKEGKQTLQDTITDIKNNGYSVTSLDVTNEKEYNVLLLEPSSDKINSSSSFKCVDLCFNPNTINDWKHGLFLKERSTGYYSKIGKDSVEIYGKTEDQPHVISIRRSNTDIEYSSSELGNTDVLIQNEGLKIGKYVTGSGYEPSSDNSNSILKKSRLDIQNLTTGGSSNTSTYISSQLYADDNGNVDKSAKIEIQGETSNIDLHGTTDSYIKINNKYVITGAEDEKRIKIWTGTQDQYDQIEAKDENTLYFITA